jgi:selenoprotein W-related protein
MNVRIVYCVPCGFLPQAMELAKNLLSRYGQRLNKKFSVTLRQRVFGVYIDGVKVFSRHERRIFPNTHEIAELIEKRIKKVQTGRRDPSFHKTS